MGNLSDYTEQNRRAWNEVAETRHALWPGADYYAQGGCTLDSRVRLAAGDVRDAKLLHLQCATGEDTLSWAVTGAVATGVDISELQIELAQRKAAQADLPVQFIAADVYALPESLRRGAFDLVYMGHGTLVWLPDLDVWAHVVESALRPGGRFILFEEHPLAGCVWAAEDRLHVECDYFGRHQPAAANGWRHFTQGAGGPATSVGFNWPLGDIVTAIVRAGLHIQRLEEFPGQAAWRFGASLSEAQRLPGDYLLVASKPE